MKPNYPYTRLYSCMLKTQQFQGVEASETLKPLQRVVYQICHFRKMVANPWQTSICNWVKNPRSCLTDDNFLIIILYDNAHPSVSIVLFKGGYFGDRPFPFYVSFIQQGLRPSKRNNP